MCWVVIVVLLCVREGALDGVRNDRTVISATIARL